MASLGGEGVSIHIDCLHGPHSLLPFPRKETKISENLMSFARGPCGEQEEAQRTQGAPGPLRAI